MLHCHAQIDSVINHFLLTRTVIDHNGQLHHVFPLQFPGVHDRDDIAVLFRCSGQIQYKRRIQIADHLHAQFALGVMTFIDNDDWRLLIQHLGQRVFRYVSDHGFPMLIGGHERLQGSIFLISFPAFLPLGAKAIKAHDDNGEIFPHRCRCEVLRVLCLGTIQNLHTTTKVRVNLTAIGMIGVPQRGKCLLQNSI